MTKETAELLLKLLAQVQISVTAQNAEEDFQALLRAKKELLEIVNAK